MFDLMIALGFTYQNKVESWRETVFIRIYIVIFAAFFSLRGHAKNG